MQVPSWMIIALVRTMPHPIPTGYQSHGPLMLFAHVFHELGI